MVVFALFFYRKTVLGGSGSIGHFLIGFFFLYTSLGVIALAAPEIAGMFALLVMAGDLLTNGQQVAQGVSKSLKQPATKSTNTNA